MEVQAPASPSLRAWAARFARYAWVAAIALLAAILWWGPASVASFLMYAAIALAAAGFVLAILATNLRSHGLSHSFHDTSQPSDDITGRHIAAATSRVAIVAWLLAGLVFALSLLLRSIA